MTQHISCDLHDYIEVACMYGYQVRLILKDQSTVEGKAKDILTAKAMSQGSSALAVGQGATRIVYNCVAKRLIKIERGRGEQTVKFNM